MIVLTHGDKLIFVIVENEWSISGFFRKKIFAKMLALQHSKSAYEWRIRSIRIGGAGISYLEIDVWVLKTNLRYS
jgi:hypothetical protein